MKSRVVHFEIPSDEPEKAMDFFEKTFGWQFDKFGEEDYWFAKTGEDDNMGIDGGIMKRNDPNQPVVNSIMVESVEESSKKIEENGGKVVVPKFAIPGMGWIAYFQDPDGNVHGIWENDEDAA